MNSFFPILVRLTLVLVELVRYRFVGNQEAQDIVSHRNVRAPSLPRVTAIDKKRKMDGWSV